MIPVTTAIMDGYETTILVDALGGRPGKRYLVGCEPDVLETDGIGMSPSVRAAVPQAKL